MQDPKKKRIKSSHPRNARQNILSLSKGREALKAYRQKRPVRDLVVMDIRASRQNRMKELKNLRVVKPAAIVVWSRNSKEKNKSEQSE